MQIDVDYRCFGSIDVATLQEKLVNLPDEFWELDQSRQQNFKIHSQTKSIIFKFTDQIAEVKFHPVWGDFSEILEIILNESIIKVFGNDELMKGMFLKIMLAKLPSHSEIPEHWDRGHCFALSHRYHIPIHTHEHVDFFIEDQKIPMKEGMLYEINNLKIHSVKNKSPIDRVHLIFDYMTSSQLQRLHKSFSSSLMT